MGKLATNMDKLEIRINVNSVLYEMYKEGKIDNYYFDLLKKVTNKSKKEVLDQWKDDYGIKHGLYTLIDMYELETLVENSVSISDVDRAFYVNHNRVNDFEGFLDKSRDRLKNFNREIAEEFLVYVYCWNIFFRHADDFLFLDKSTISSFSNDEFWRLDKMEKEINEVIFKKSARLLEYIVENYSYYEDECKDLIDEYNEIRREYER